jgi:hypothetical protein
MGTQHPTLRERAAIKFRADQGDESAQNYLKLLDGCTSILESSNGISLARGLSGEHDDTYGEAIDDALSELVPLILEIAAGGWDSLRFYARPDQLPKEEQK